MTSAPDPNVLPVALPVPEDDGAARHLAGMAMPSVRLAATDGAAVDLSRLTGRTVVYIYPRTGRPGVALPDGWDAIPGARGCTPQSCSFRDHFAELNCSAFRPRTLTISGKPSSACTCRSRFSPTLACSLPTRSVCRPSRSRA